MSISLRTATPETRWFVIAMESTAIFPALDGLLSGDPRTGTLRAVLLTALLALACVTVPHLRRLRAGWGQILVGFAVAAAINLALTWPGGGAAGITLPLILVWVFTAIPATGLGGIVWWRGVALTDAELTREEVRTELIVLGGGLMILLMLFRAVLGLSDAVLVVVVGLFLGCGLGAVALARQDAAGAERTVGRIGLALLLALAPVVLALAVVAFLQPAVVGAAANQIDAAVELLLALLALLLAPLAGLLASWHVQVQPTTARPFGNLGGGGPIPHLEVPEWLVVTGITLGVVLGLLVAALVVWMLGTTILPALFRERSKAIAPEDLESEGDVGDDARALASGLGLWLAGLMRWAGQHTSRETARLTDARAVYRALLRWARSQGIERQAAETPGQLCNRLSAAYPDDRSTFTQLTAAYEQQRYGEQVVPPNELADLVRQVTTLLRPDRGDDLRAT